MKIRKAIVSDARAIAKVHVDSWKTTYKGIVPDDYLNSLKYETREQLWTDIIPKQAVFVAETDTGEIVGFANGGKERSGDYPDYSGELYAIYILKDYQMRGIGKLLVKAVIDELIENELFSMTVIVLEDNKSRYFYESLAVKTIDTLEVEIAGKKLKELVQGWNDIRNIIL